VDRAALGVTVNEMFGQTEVNYIVVIHISAGQRWPAMGGPIPATVSL